MLKSDAIYNSSFRFQDIDFNNINDIYFAINIIVIIATTLFEAFIVMIFIFKLIIVIVINVNIVIIFVTLERLIVKFIVFDFDIKRRLIMSASLDKS